MYDIILIHDLDVYELGVRGDLVDANAAADLDRCLACLGGTGSVVVDLTGVARMDRAVATSLVESISALVTTDVAVACAVASPAVRAMLERSSASSVAVICTDVDTARSAARRKIAA